ncbi:MAG TPA: hypothetical protein VMZ91_15755 [Candidatus Paceibacterota bacterium]|nr:hypothetical protein [Candidatus Paceibacterota bacterium]
MDKVAKVLTDALLENDFIINTCEFKEGFLTERYEIRFSKDNFDYKIQIFEAVADYPGFINYDYELGDLKEIVKFVLEALKRVNFEIGKMGSSTSKDFYIKIKNEEFFFDIYIDRN